MNIADGGRVESVDTLRRPEHTVMRDRSMRVIMPSTTSSFVNIIHTIKLLDEFLSLSTTRRVFDAILDPDVNAIVKNSPKKIKQKVDQYDSQDQQPPQHPEILNNADAINGIRHIQGGRYEVFVKARVKSTCVFDWICQQIWTMHYEQLPQAPAGNINEFASYESSDHIKQAIMQYATHQAERDDRITVNAKNKSAPSYDNFSLIVSYDPVEAQPRHIDLLYPNFQFGLIITDNSPGTSVYVTPHSIRTVTDVKNHVWKNMSSTMFSAMEQHAIVTSLLSQFGDVLCPSMEIVQYWKHCNDTKKENEEVGEGTTEQPPNATHEMTTSNDMLFPTGTLLSLPGSEIHAGPASLKYRTVLFFSACPNMTNTIPYHPDTQYFSPLLCCDFVCLLWNNLSIDDRIYILNRLIDCIIETKCQHLDRHIADAKMIHFLRIVTGREETIESPRCRVTKYGRYSNMQDYIRFFASQRKAIDSEKNGVDIVGAIPEYHESLQLTNTATEYQPTTMTVISRPDLVVEFEGEYFPAHVFEHQVPTVSVMASSSPIHQDDIIRTGSERQNVSKVMLFYPLDQSWEGNIVPYTLEWTQEGNVPSTTSATNSDIENSDVRKRFDGTNGILRDSDGCVISCYPQCLTSVSSQANDPMIKKPKKRKRRKSIIPLSVRPRLRKPIQTIDETSTTISSERMLSSPKSETVSLKSSDDVEMINSPGMHKRPGISEGGVMYDILQYIRS